MIDSEKENVWRLRDLGMLPGADSALREAFALTSGLVLLTGPTGSGKTHTANVLRGSTQRECLAVSPHLESSEPGMQPKGAEILFVGDIRSPTAAVWATAMSRRSLVVAVLRSGESRGAPGRLLEMGVSAEALLAGMMTVMTQRLCRRLCVECRAPMGAPLSAFQKAQVGHAFELAGRHSHMPVGCPVCGGTGYRGWVPIYEVLVLDAKAAHADGDGLGDAMISRMSLSDHAAIRVLTGETSLAELCRVLPQRAAFPGPGQPGFGS